MQNASQVPQPSRQRVQGMGIAHPLWSSIVLLLRSCQSQRHPMQGALRPPTNTRQEARIAPPLPHLCRHRHRLHPAARAVRPDAAIVLLQPRQLAEVSILPLLHQACPESRVVVGVGESAERQEAAECVAPDDSVGQCGAWGPQMQTGENQMGCTGPLGQPSPAKDKLCAHPPHLHSATLI